jgi:hypothetical protein
MTNEQIEGLWKLAILVIPAVAGVTIWVVKYLKLQEVKAKENSLGATRASEFLKVQDEQGDIIKKINANYERVVKDLAEMTVDYKEMVRSALRFIERK